MLDGGVPLNTSQDIMLHEQCQGTKIRRVVATGTNVVLKQRDSPRYTLKESPLRSHQQAGTPKALALEPGPLQYQ